MRHLSISEFSSYRWTFFQDVVGYSKLGVHSIGVWRAKLDEFGCEEAADLLYEMNMNVSSLSWAGGFTGSDGSSLPMAIDDALDAVYQAHMIGADKLIIYPGGRNHHTESHALRLVKSALEAILPTANDLGVQLVLEPMITRHNPWSFLHEFSSYSDLIRNFCPSQVGLVFDLFHLGKCLDLMLEFPSFSDRIALVQLAGVRSRHGELVRCPLEDGDVPLGRWLQLLENAEYDGDIEIELHGLEFENQDYESKLTSSLSSFRSAHQQVQTGRVQSRTLG